MVPISGGAVNLFGFDLLGHNRLPPLLIGYFAGTYHVTLSK
jgi:hypothetical protein